MDVCLIYCETILTDMHGPTLFDPLWSYTYWHALVHTVWSVVKLYLLTCIGPHCLIRCETMLTDMHGPTLFHPLWNYTYWHALAHTVWSVVKLYLLTCTDPLCLVRCDATILCFKTWVVPVCDKTSRYWTTTRLTCCQTPWNKDCKTKSTIVYTQNRL